jgi:hypothetical protein
MERQLPMSRYYFGILQKLKEMKEVPSKYSLYPEPRVESSTS